MASQTIQQNKFVTMLMQQANGAQYEITPSADMNSITITPTIRTENNAKSNLLADTSLQCEGLLGLFYKTVRGVDKKVLNLYLQKAIQEDVMKAVLLSFYIRDCRGGKGERELGRYCLDYIARNSREGSECINKLLEEIPEYGRWDDLVVLSKNPQLTETILSIFAEQILTDVSHMRNDDPVSLCAKWMPSEGSKLDKETDFIKEYTNITGLDRKTYRKQILTPLRKHIDIVERRMCKRDWESIDFSKVPSCAMHKLRKAFQRHDPERFDVWKNGLATGETKINAKQLFPYEVVHAYNTENRGYTNDVFEAQWRVLVEETRKLGIVDNSLVVCDVSGSMTSQLPKSTATCMDVAISLALLFSEVSTDSYRNHVITFSSNPNFVRFEQSTLLERLQLIKRMDWGMNTNFEKVFDLILNSATRNNLRQEDLPKRVFVLSDMQFDQASYNKQTNFQVIRDKFRRHEYTMPTLIFWNINGKYNDFPVTVDNHGTVMISGFSQSILKYVLSMKDPSPMGIIEHTLSDERYARLRELMI